jgi:succinate-semialdehyde dehydrogenase/glutarate-semialdehyde dehydrogenase
MSPARPELSLYIAGEWLGAAGRETIPVIDPGNEDVLGELPVASGADLDAALDAASAAFAKWRKEPAVARGAVLRKAAALMRERQEASARLMSLEQGKPLFEARLELNAAADILDWAATEALRTYGRVIPSRFPDSRQTVYKEPVGVVAAFSPWNFPAATPIRKIAGSLAAGCACIIKPSEETPWTVLKIARALADAGLPAGTLNVVYGVPDEISRHLIARDEIRKVSFTGSTAVGKHLLALAAQGVKRTTMELGGHAPFLVFDDVDVVAIAQQAAASKYRNAGQICTAPTRFIVQERVYSQFVEAFTATAQSLTVGYGQDDGTKMGPVVNARRLEAMDRLVSNARAGGATVTGGHRVGNKGFFWAPTVLSDLAPDAACLHEEPFGPIAAITSFGFEEEAIRIANELPFGLASYAFTSDANRVIRLSDGIEAGMIGINSFFVTLPETPFGGVKESGFGIEGGIEGIDSYLVTKFVAQGVAVI